MSGNGNGGGGNGGSGGGLGGGTYGGTPIVPTNLIPASTTVLQPGSRYFRLVDAFAQLDQSLAVDVLNNDITALQATVAAMQGQINTLQINVTALQGQITVLQGFMNSSNWVQAEVSTGLTFLDQRTLYTRSFVISGALNTALNVFTFPHTVAAINYIAQAIGVASVNQGQAYPISYLNSAQVPSIQDAISMFADATNIYIINGSVIRTNYLCLVKLYYTATNR